MSRDDGTSDDARSREMERLWREGTLTPGQIGSRLGISHQKVVARARRCGWPRSDLASGNDAGRHAGAGAAGLAGKAGSAQRGRTDGDARDHATGRPRRRGPDVPTPAGRGHARRAIIERLFAAVDAKLRAIEERLAAGGDTTPADTERTSRSLNTLIRSLEKLEQYEHQLGKTSAAARSQNKGGGNDDPERRRAELARRIERLLDRR